MPQPDKTTIVVGGRRAARTLKAQCLLATAMLLMKPGEKLILLKRGEDATVITRMPDRLGHDNPKEIG